MLIKKGVVMLAIFVYVSSIVLAVDCAKIETSSTFYRFGDYASDIKQYITNSDLPNLLATRRFMDSSGNEYEVQPRIKTPTAVIRFDKTIPDIQEPELFMDFETNATNMGFFRTEIDFPIAVNLSLSGGKALPLFGKEYVIGESWGEVICSGTPKVTLYAAAVDKTFTAGETSTVYITGTQVTITVVGVNTQSIVATATITVNGESKSVTAGNTYIIGGQRVYVKDVFAYTAPSSGGAVRLFIGVNKIVLENGQSVATGTGSTFVYGTMVDIATSNNKCSKIGINITPYNMVPRVDALFVGKSIMDPVFGAYNLTFIGPIPPLDDASRDVIKLYPSSEDKFRLEFTNRNGQIYVLDILKGNIINNEILLQSGDYRIVNENNKQIRVNDYLIIKDNNDYSHILRLLAVINGTLGQGITVEDVAENGINRTWSFSNGMGQFTYDGQSHNFIVNVWNATDGNISLSDGASKFLYTKSGAMITLPIPVNALSQNVSRRGTVVNITEETSYNMEGAATDYGLLVFTLNYTNGLSGNDFYQTTPDYTKTAGANDWDGFDLVGNSGYNYEAVTPYGTFVKWNSDQNSYKAEVYYSGTQTKFNVCVSPIVENTTPPNTTTPPNAETPPDTTGTNQTQEGNCTNCTAARVDALETWRQNVEWWRNITDGTLGGLGSDMSSQKVSILTLQNKSSEFAAWRMSVGLWQTNTISFLNSMQNNISNISTTLIGYTTKVTNCENRISILENSTRTVNINISSSAYFNYLSSSDRRNMVCGFAQDNNLTRIIDLGLNCTLDYRYTRTRVSVTCRCRNV